MRPVIAGSLIDGWSLSSLLSSPMQRSAGSEGVNRMEVDKWVIRQAEEPAELSNTLLLRKQQIESSEPETIAG